MHFNFNIYNYSNNDNNNISFQSPHIPNVLTCALLQLGSHLQKQLTIPYSQCTSSKGHPKDVQINDLDFHFDIVGYSYSHFYIRGSCQNYIE